MNKIFFSFITFLLLTACSVDDSRVNYHLELLPVQEVEIPESFVMGEKYVIKVRFFRPTTCHTYNKFYYESYLNERTIAVESFVTERDGCVALSNELVEEKMDFYVTSNGSYIFKFWNGVDENGDDVYLIYEVPVN
jgi:hypothetical protein